MLRKKPAVGSLILKDGTVFKGTPFGSQNSTAGEVVFNTGMVGYPESMTDPSYNGQILVFTYPLIGNYGVRQNPDSIADSLESSRIQVKGIIVSDYSANYSHWSAIKSLDEWMKEEGIPGIYGIDTRQLTKRLREKGVMLGKIINRQDTGFYDPNKEILQEYVSVKSPVTYGSGKPHIVLVDCGVKNSIIRSLLRRKVRLTQVPYDYDFTRMKYDGLFISNGPGDPKSVTQAIENVRIAMDSEKPVFGICMGNQIMALAAGGATYKLKFGHRSQNQPCIEQGTKRCYITSQNHGYAVNDKKLPSGWKPWFRNANDGTNEGIIHKTGLFRAIQFHAEHNPGPRDTEFMFDNFIRMVREGR